MSNDTGLPAMRMAARISEILASQLGPDNIDVDIIPLPSTGDRMARLRTLEEMLDQFDEGESPTAGYFVHVRPNRPTPSKTDRIPAPIENEPRITLNSGKAAGTDGMYLADGKLNVPFLLGNADLLLNAGDAALARNIYKAVLQSGDQSALALAGLSRCYEATGELDLAIANLEESIAYHPRLDAYRKLSELLQRQRKDQEAAEVLERALSLREIAAAEHATDRLWLHVACAQGFTRADQLDAAERHIASAAGIDAAFAGQDTLWVSIGDRYAKAGKPGEARRKYERALAINAACSSAMTGLGQLSLEEGDKRGAHDWFARSLEANLSNPTAIFYLVKCAYEIRSYAVAARLVEEYTEIAPVNANLFYSLAGLQFHLGRLEDSRATCDRILRLNASHSGAQELIRLIDKNSQPQQ